MLPHRLTLALLLLGGTATAAPVDFVRDVRPIFERYCYECHGPNKQKNGFRLDVKSAAFKGGDDYSPSIIPGKGADSPLVKFVGPDADLQMPPEGDGPSAEQIATLMRWIDEGAHWPDGVDAVVLVDPKRHWSFQSVTRPQPPPTENTTWPRGDIDRFVLAALERQNLRPAPAADRVTWLRRVYFNLIGLPPTPRQIREFVEDPRDDAAEHVVDELLKSPRYGERWAQHWLDVIRYADTHGFEVNTPRENAWPYRDYVIRAFNDDKPYDAFVREQLAGDLLGAEEATGFLVTAAALLPGQIGQDDASKRLARQDALDEIIVGTSGTLLGLTIGCARCHDHKFDPISQADYYSLQAFFAGVEYGDRPIHDVDYRLHQAEAAALAPRIEQLQNQLRQYEPVTTPGLTLLIDVEDPRRFTSLRPSNGRGENPAGTKRGYRDDPGAVDRVGNISRGHYTWWTNQRGEDVGTYRPGVAGRFQLWLSWGAHGSGVHTRDARYVLDADGNLATRDDQRELARVDQYYLAGVKSGETEQTPLWSGLLDVGVVDLTSDAKIVLRGGDTGTGITADVIVLQEIDTDSSVTPLPNLRAPINPRQNVERFPAVPAKFVRFTTYETIDNDRHEPCLDELEVFAQLDPSRNVALATAGAVATSSGNLMETGIHQLRHINDGRYGNEQSWISNQRGGGWVQIELPELVEIDRLVWGRDRNGKFPDRLPVRYQIDVSADDASWQTVATHADRMPVGSPYDPQHLLLRGRVGDEAVDVPGLIAELNRLQAEQTRLETPRMVFGGLSRVPDKTFILRRGDPEQPTKPVSTAVPAFFGTASPPEDIPEPERRLALAKWIASPDHPLTARVLVNRVWQGHFGTGLVETPNDFGLNGQPPSHPELLDWLASEFVRGGWSLKHLQRLIVLSATYGQSSRIDPAALEVDRDNRFLWRYPTRRLDAELIRDSMLAISGELNLQMSGPGFNFFQVRGGLSGYPPVEQFGPNELRRMIYSHKVRMESVPVFGAFDCPDAGQAMPRRNQSTTAIQALNLFNSEFVAERAEKLAARVQQLTPVDINEQIRTAFQLALGRDPSATERSSSLAAVQTHGLATLCRVLFNASEFLFIP